MSEAPIKRQTPQIIDAFARAERYDAHAIVQRWVAAELADTIAALPFQSAPVICELGCGTGFLGEAIGRRLPNASWLATDISPQMVDRARDRLGHDPRFSFAQLDADDPQALAGGRDFDLICSNFAAQWFSDLRGVFDRMATRLKPGGWVLLTTLAEGSLDEWRLAHAQLGLTAGTPSYPALDELRAMRPASMTGDVETKTYREAFTGPLEFSRSLRAIGAGTPRRGHVPLTAGQLRCVLRNFDVQGRTISWVVATCSFARPADSAFRRH